MAYCAAWLQQQSFRTLATQGRLKRKNESAQPHRISEHETEGRVGHKQFLSDGLQETEGRTGIYYHYLVSQYKQHI